MAGLRIRLPGGFELAREGRTLEQLPLRAARSLFAYLVLNRERPHTRDLLAGTVWPGFDGARAPPRRGRRLPVLPGRHPEAIRQYEECRRILSEELGSRPSPETVALYEATLADRDSGGRAVAPHDDSPLFEDTSHAPFVGRDAERGQFAHRLDAALDGRGGGVPP